MKNIKEIDLTKGLEVKEYAKELAKKEYDSEVVSFDNWNKEIRADVTVCCGDDIEDITYDFCLEDSDSGEIYDVYCGSKCFIVQHNFVNRFNDDWKEITKEQIDLISVNC
tara:strand:- start:4433 stop:4762 length:330 start_codon:yes stop_codon:yes gene_type:complete